MSIRLILNWLRKFIVNQGITKAKTKIRRATVAKILKNLIAISIMFRTRVELFNFFDQNVLYLKMPGSIF